jgi:glycine oxidase
MKAGIAGGGIMGQLLAFSFINAGWHVTLFDRSITNNCSMAAAGLLAPIAELEKNDLIIFQLGKEALEKYWPAILLQLPSNIYFQHTGSLIVAHPHDHADLTNYMQIIASKLKNNNFYRLLNQTEIKQFEPGVAKFNHAYYFANEGQIDNQMLMPALKNYLLAKKINWIENAFVSAIQPCQINLTNKIYRFDLVVDCRGLGATDNFHNLRSVRGELIWLEAPDVSITRPIRFLHPRYSLYIVPRPKNIYLLGASEIESNDAANISVKTTLELLTAAYYINSSFSEARIIKTVTQCRPTLTNHLPQIKYCPGFIAVNGLYRHGFLLAPTLAQEIMHWVQTGKITRYAQLWEKYT